MIDCWSLVEFFQRLLQANHPRARHHEAAWHVRSLNDLHETQDYELYGINVRGGGYLDVAIAAGRVRPRGFQYQEQQRKQRRHCEIEGEDRDPVTGWHDD